MLVEFRRLRILLLSRLALKFECIQLKVDIKASLLRNVHMVLPDIITLRVNDNKYTINSRLSLLQWDTHLLLYSATFLCLIWITREISKIHIAEKLHFVEICLIRKTKWDMRKYFWAALNFTGTFQKFLI